MSIYAIINQETGLVENTAEWDGESEWPQVDGYIVVPSAEASTGWSYIDGEFIAPPDLPVTPPTAEETFAANTAMQAIYKSQASTAMTPLLLSLQLGDATEEETALAKLWQAYSRALKAVDLTEVSPAWPDIPA